MNHDAFVLHVQIWDDTEHNLTTHLPIKLLWQCSINNPLGIISVQANPKLRRIISYLRGNIDHVYIEKAPVL